MAKVWCVSVSPVDAVSACVRACVRMSACVRECVSVYECVHYLPGRPGLLGDHLVIPDGYWGMQGAWVHG